MKEFEKEQQDVVTLAGISEQYCELSSEIQRIRSIVELNNNAIHHNIGLTNQLVRFLVSKETTFFKEQAIQFRLFDEYYYCSHYPEYINYGQSPIDHFFSYGWQLGYNPSAQIDNNRYIRINQCTYCPITHFLIDGRFRGYIFHSNPYKQSKEELEDYLVNRDHRRAYKVLYTCLIQDYDDLMPIQHLHDDWDYVCFTDNEELLQQKNYYGWEILKAENNLSLDATRLNRWYKTHPHILFPNYNESIYIDSNINILTRFIYDLAMARNQEILLPKHFATQNIYEHFNWAMNRGIDDLDILKRQKQLYEDEGFPISIGLAENNIIYRKHMQPSIVNLMEDWWEMILKYSKRDQLSLAYVMWKNSMIIDDYLFNNPRPDIADFLFVTHKTKERV